MRITEVLLRHRSFFFFPERSFLWVMARLVLLSCLLLDAQAEPSNGRRSAANTLSHAERSVGWKLLFDGKATSSWRGFRRADFPLECWTVEQGMLKRVKGIGGNHEDCGDIVTVDQYENFELQLEWKMEPGGNSGVKYLVLEDRPASWEQAYLDQHVESLKKSGRSEPAERLTLERWKYKSMGFELQLIDDLHNADALKSATRITGALYDLIAPKQRSIVSMDEFNTARIVVNGTHIEHWVNGAKVVEFERGSEALHQLVDASKFRHLKGFGSVAKGHIALQDHNSAVSFRNIRIRLLAVGFP